MSGGKAIEHLAKEGNRFHFTLSPPMQNAKNCNFSFTGLQHVIDKLIKRKEQEEGIEKGQILSSAADIAAAVQHVTACHLATRTHRALLFCRQRAWLPPANAVLVSFARSPARPLAAVRFPACRFGFRALCLLLDSVEQYERKAMCSHHEGRRHICAEKQNPRLHFLFEEGLP